MLTQNNLFWTSECPEIRVKLKNKEVAGSAKIFSSKLSHLEGEIVLKEPLLFFQETEHITGITKEGHRIFIYNPFVTKILLTNPVPITMTKVAVKGNMGLEPNTVVCYLKNIGINFIGKINYGNEKFELGAISSKSGVPEKGRIGARLLIKDSKLGAEEIDRLLDAICSLLSISQRIPVSIACIQRYCGDEFVSAEAYHLVDDHKPVVPMIFKFADHVCEFVTKTLPSFIKNESNYNLHVLTHYYCRAFTELFDESKFIFGSIFMEALKFNWAKNISSLKVENNPNGTIKKFLDPITGEKLGFRKLIESVAGHLGYTPSKFSFIDNRNMLFHTGLSLHDHLGHKTPNDVLWQELLRLYDQMDELLLRILDYSGNIYSVRYPNASRKFPR